LKSTVALGLALLVSGLLISSAHARIVPAFNPRTEDVIVGPGKIAQSPKSVGPWTAKPGWLAPQVGGKHWLVDAQGQTITSGTIRARFDNPQGIDVALLFRAKGAPNGSITQGYGLAIWGRNAAIVAFRDGRATSLKRRKIGRTKAGSISVVLTLLDRHLLANVYETRSGKLLANLAVSEIPNGTGALGVWAGKGWRSTSPMTLLSTRAACMDMPKDEARGPAHVVRIAEVGGVNPGDWGDPVQRFAGTPPTVAVRMGPLGVERAYCEGPELLDVTNDLPWKFVDPAYRRYSKRGPISRGPRGFDLSKSYKNVKMVNALLTAWHRAHPKRTLLRKIGTSRQGREIMALAIADNIKPGDPRPSVLLNATHHGNEPMSTEFVLDAIQQLVEPNRLPRNLRAIRRDLVVWAVPMVNPDGNWGFFETSKRLGRKNGRDIDGDGRWTMRDGVDLNRNYPFKWGALGERGSQSDSLSRYYRGDRAASEPETKAVIALSDQERFVASVSFHTGTVAVLAPYTIDNLNNPQPNAAWSVAEDIVRGLPRHPGGKNFAVARQLYSVDGTDQDWHRHRHGTLALLVEGVRRTPKDMKKRGPLVDAVRPLWTRLFNRYLQGPSVYGTVTDRNGKPVYAEVRVREVTLREGERWMTRCRDGHYDRFLKEPGRYTLDIRAAGMAPFPVSVYAGGRERVEINVQLPGDAIPAAECPIR
jgi:hypothetical protein